MLRELVRARLDSLGIAYDAGDEWMLDFLEQKVRRHLLSRCGLSELPEGLWYGAAEQVCGEYLLCKKATAPESLEGLDLGAAVRRITEGDTTVEYAVGSGSEAPEARLDALIAYLTRERDLAAYRRPVF